MFASLTGVLMLAQALPVAVLGAASYSDELKGAYEYAYSKNITTMSSIDNANMYGELTRGQLAKMIANWAEKEMGTKVDETAVCSFSDANTAEGDLATYVKKACQMGLMGQGIEKFRPNDKVTRGEFGTTLSRALWGDKYNGATPFYKNHLEALKEAGIMKMIDTPNQMEIRGYVMLMLQRSTDVVSPAECKDPTVVLACSLNSDACPAKCRKADNGSGTVNTGAHVAGDLNVSVVDYSASVKSAPKGIFVANTLKFAASEKINLDTLTLKRTGLGSRKDIKKVWLERNGVAVTNAASVGSDGLAVLNFKSNRNVVNTDAKTQELELVVELDKDATIGAEVAFDLLSVTSSAKNTTVKGSTSTYRVSAYEVVKLIVDIVNRSATPIEYKLGNQKDYVIGEFSLESDSESDDRDVTVRSLTFRNNGSLDFENTFKNVKVYRDSKVVSNAVEVNGRDITIALDKDPIKANRKAIYTIRAEVASLEDVNKTVQLKLRDEKDVIADEVDTHFRTTIAFGNVGWASTTKGELNIYKFLGGKVMFEGTANFPKTVDVGVGASDVTIAKGKLVVTEPVELPKIVFNYVAGTSLGTSTGWATNDALTGNALRRLVLKVGDKRYSADPDNAGKVVFSDVVVRETSDVELLISLASNVKEGSKLHFSNLGSALMTNKGSYQNNDADLTADQIAGVIQTAEVLVKKPKFTITADNINTQQTVVNDAAVVTLMKGKLEAKEKDVNVNSFTVALEGDALVAGESVEVFLDLNGQPWSNATLKNGESYTFNSLGSLKAKENLPFQIRVQPTIGTAKNIYLAVQAKGTDVNGNEAETSKEYSATLEVKRTADIEVTNIVASDRVVEPTQNTLIYAGTLNVKNGSSTLTGFGLSGSTIPTGITNYRLYVDGDFVTGGVVSTTGVAFSNFVQNLQQGDRTVEVKANVTTNSGTNVDAYKYVIDGVLVNGKYYKKEALAYFAKGFFNLAKTSTSDAVLIVKLTNNSPKSIDVKGISFDSGATVASASVNNQNVTVTANEGTFVSQTVAAGSSINIQVIAKKDSLAKLTGVTYTVTDGSDVYTYKLDDTMSSVATWGLLFSSK